VYFLENPGTLNGRSFPPGSGNIDPLTVSFSSGVDILGSGVTVQSLTNTQGSTPIDGAFTLALDGTSTDPIVYDQQPLEAKYLLEATGTVGTVDVGSQYRYMQKLPGVYASADRDSYSLTIEYDDNSTYAPIDIRHMLGAGDLFRLGGLDEQDVSGVGQTSIDGATFYAMAEAVPGSAVLALASGLLPTVYPGEHVRLGGDKRVGTSTSACGGFGLSFLHQWKKENTTCIQRPYGGDMTTAAALKESFDQMQTVSFDDIEVTRSAKADCTAYVFSIYFEGPGVLGNVNQLSVNYGCGTTLVYSGTSVSVMTMVQATAVAVAVCVL
jgi:hypothetical protein